MCELNLWELLPVDASLRWLNTLHYGSLSHQCFTLKYWTWHITGKGSQTIQNPELCFFWNLRFWRQNFHLF